MGSSGRWCAPAAAALLLLAGCAAPGSDGAVRLALRKVMRERVRSLHQATVDMDDVQPLARRFYRRRKFQPAWTHARGPTDEARELVAEEEGSAREGLDPANYDVERTRRFIHDS